MPGIESCVGNTNIGSEQFSITKLVLKMDVLRGKQNMPRLASVFAVGDDVTVVGDCRRMNLQGVVVRLTRIRVIIVDDAGFLHWFDESELMHTFGPYW